MIFCSALLYINCWISVQNKQIKDVAFSSGNLIMIFLLITFCVCVSKFNWRITKKTQKTSNWKKTLQDDGRLSVAISLTNLAELYKNQGRYKEAEPFFLEALDMRKSLLGEEHPDIAQSLNNLALLHYSQGRYSEARIFLDVFCLC